jgi:hypothetical protein
MTYHPKLSEQLAVVARIKPQALTAAAESLSDAIDMRYHSRILVIFNMGDYAAGNDGSVVVRLKGATASGGTYSNITSKLLTTASFTGSAQDDAVGIIELTAEDLVTTLGQAYRYVKVSVTPSNQNLTCGVVVLADHSRYSPAGDYDLTDVTEIIN